jgi:hypothetical protein
VESDDGRPIVKDDGRPHWMMMDGPLMWIALLLDGPFEVASSLLLDGPFEMANSLLLDNPLKWLEIQVSQVASCGDATCNKRSASLGVALSDAWGAASWWGALKGGALKRGATLDIGAASCTAFVGVELDLMAIFISSCCRWLSRCLVASPRVVESFPRAAER